MHVCLAAEEIACLWVRRNQPSARYVTKDNFIVFNLAMIVRNVVDTNKEYNTCVVRHYLLNLHYIISNRPDDRTDKEIGTALVTMSTPQRLFEKLFFFFAATTVNDDRYV